MWSGKDYVLGILKKKSERDLQKLVGASDISQLCDRCLVERMNTEEGTQSHYWLGARIGTAVHQALEDGAPPGVNPEMRVRLGEIPGYGEIYSTTDLYEPTERVVVDFKTTTRSKLKLIKNAFNQGGGSNIDINAKVTAYVGQIMLYAWGLEQAGYPVERVSITFICRDGTSDPDIWEWQTDYNEDIALTFWNRVLRLWSERDELHESHDGCYTCSQLR